MDDMFTAFLSMYAVGLGTSLLWGTFIYLIHKEDEIREVPLASNHEWMMKWGARTAVLCLIWPVVWAMLWRSLIKGEDYQ